MVKAMCGANLRNREKEERPDLMEMVPAHDCVEEG